ncbi:PREDICTED: uncharacterized protein LOC108576743 [Habropoda laboriosa]|uniref:uncharacterized protein LOC108576743 n=1 Tax=Habropoda laboriosa TaxID=597456 RepID=UPI00083DD677|nr:PREDICTED: uncharacterized protein LOC108576743 [Habropoda laboriosa]
MKTFLDSRYFSYVRFFLRLIVLSPLGKSKGQRIRRCPVYVCTVMQVWTLMTLKDDLKTTIASLPYVVSSLIITIKYFTCYLNYNMIKKLFVTIGENWMELKCKNEMNLMEKYTHDGYLYTVFFTWLTIVSCCLISTLGLIVLIFRQKFLESANNLLLLLPSWIYGDTVDSKVSVLLFCVIFIMIIAVMLTTDLIYITLTYHACAMISVTGHRLQHLFDDVKRMRNTEQKNTLLHVRVAKAIRYHWKCMKYVNGLESCYTVSLFLQHIMITIVITSKLYRVYSFSMTGRANLIIVSVDIAYTLGLLFANVYPAERLTDCGQNLYHNVYNAHWYDTPASTQKVIQIMLQKISEPFYFGISGLFSASFETCSKIIRNRPIVDTVWAPLFFKSSFKAVHFG